MNTDNTPVITTIRQQDVNRSGDPTQAIWPATTRNITEIDAAQLQADLATTPTDLLDDYDEEP